jgi:hypothetical protein
MLNHRQGVLIKNKIILIVCLFACNRAPQRQTSVIPKEDESPSLASGFQKFNISRQPFSEPDTTTVYATKFVRVDKDDITDVIHSTDGKWEFISKDHTYTPETALKPLQLVEIIQRDSSILGISKLPCGYYARRSSKQASWFIRKMRGK